MTATQVLAPDERWHLYKLLADPVRLRLLALAGEEELAMGELADLLGESMPSVSRHAAPLRQASLLLVRRQGTRMLARLAEGAKSDPVVADALDTGRTLCREDGSLKRVEPIVRARDARTREFFDAHREDSAPPGVSSELPAYLHALAPYSGRRSLAVDAGTGDGAVLDALAPLFTRVVALDRSAVQLRAARRRCEHRGYENVELVRGEVDGDEITSAAGASADVVVAVRMLHHAPRPRRTMAALAALVRGGGALVIVDYAAYDDESFRERQADVWMGFEKEELANLARACGLTCAGASQIPTGCTGSGPDRHLVWLSLIAEKAERGASPVSASQAS